MRVQLSNAQRKTDGIVQHVHNRLNKVDRLITIGWQFTNKMFIQWWFCWSYIRLLVRLDWNVGGLHHNGGDGLHVRHLREPVVSID